jgi:hypothetical protein
MGTIAGNDGNAKKLMGTVETVWKTVTDVAHSHKLLLYSPESPDTGFTTPFWSRAPYMRATAVATICFPCSGTNVYPKGRRLRGGFEVGIVRS